MTVEEYVDKVEEGQIKRHDIRVFTEIVEPTWNRSMMRRDSDKLLYLLNGRNSLVLNDTEKIMVYYDLETRAISYGMPSMVRIFKKVDNDGRIWLQMVETDNSFDEEEFIKNLDEYDNKDINSFGIKPLD